MTLSCSKDESTTGPDASNRKITTKSLDPFSYPQFTSTWTGLYGDQYNFDDGNEYKDESDTYLVYQLNLGKDGSGVVGGFLIKNTDTGETMYLAHNVSIGTADVYTTSGKDIIKETYTLTLDPIYPVYGLDPTMPFAFEPGPIRRFWGWGKPYNEECGPTPGGQPGECSRLTVKTYYVLGIGVKTENIQQLNGQGDLRSPCDCPE